MRCDWLGGITSKSRFMGSVENDDRQTTNSIFLGIETDFNRG
jgi:hypothetical protein